MVKTLFVLLVCENGCWSRAGAIQGARSKLQSKARRGDTTLVYVSDDPNVKIEGLNTVYKAECFCTFIGTI